MTKFEPLTEAALQNFDTDGLTLSEIKSALGKHGLDLQYVVHDPSRPTFGIYYADYDRGLYGDIFLQRNMIKIQNDPQRPVTEELSSGNL